MSRSAPPVWLIGGPTGSGKSAAAIRLALSTGAEIINADSMQLYRDLCILTARPRSEALAAAPHHLYGVADAADVWSAGRWLRAALEVMAQVASRGRPAILVGGTGLYFRALTLGLAEIPPVPEAVRAKIVAEFLAKGEAAIRARLAAVDPRAEARIAAGDRQRLTRALEVHDATGQALSDWQDGTAPTLASAAWRGVVISPDRASLYRRLEARLEAMSAMGALEEVSALLARGLDPALPAMKALGVTAFASQLRGEITADQALAQAQMETRRYAKRQMLWFRRQTPEWPRVESALDDSALAGALGLALSAQAPGLVWP